MLHLLQYFQPKKRIGLIFLHGEEKRMLFGNREAIELRNKAYQFI